jgi:cell wall-associated NlpC family hydrolase
MQAPEPADTESMRWPPTLVALALACALGATAATAAPPADPAQPVQEAAAAAWDPQEIATVVAKGLLGPSVAEFRPSEPLTWAELEAALAAWGHPIAPPAFPDRAVTVRELDARLVDALGLLPASRAIRVAARDAGLDPIPSLGTETVARLLGLRTNHPVGQDALELLPAQPVTRAEAAFSLARSLAVTDWQRQQVLDETATFSFPALDDWQRLVLTRALRFVGYPYVFSGTSEKREQTLWDGTVVPGGFDCSGYVWRVYKLQPFPGAPALGETLQGRTTYAMSGEVPAGLRVRPDELAPGDVVFFGARGARSKPSEIGHMGIALGNGWFVHSSSHGVTVEPLVGWYATRLAWARRPLAEAGLDGRQVEPAPDLPAGA